MKNLKFRAWDTVEKKMLNEALMIGNIGLGEGSVLASQQSQTDNPLIWMQFVGLKDKNGKEVYEGDIIGFKCNHCANIHRGKILYIEEMACFGIHTEDNQEAFLHVPMDAEKLEKGFGAFPIDYILGNIYENPELLKYERE